MAVKIADNDGNVVNRGEFTIRKLYEEVNMPTKDYDYITYDKRLFRLRFETPLGDLSEEQQFERGLQTVVETTDALDPLLCPTDIEYVVSSVDGEDAHEKKLSDKIGIPVTEVISSIRKTAESIPIPQLALLEFTGSVRITLSDGAHYLGGEGNLSAVEKRMSSSSDVSIPLEISIRQHDVMRPSQTEIISVHGHSDHWLDGDEAKFYLPEATPLAKIDQSRLAAALSTLYDAVDPVEIVFDTFKTQRDGIRPNKPFPPTSHCRRDMPSNGFSITSNNGTPTRTHLNSNIAATKSIR